ncbi:MAG: hypothetical protein K5840_05065 [Eubacterium sp.]|nr:hypothetical protein [Eubacterium sp.]
MKKLALLVCVGILFLSGCGTPLIELTDEENREIVSYASYILLKYNGAAAKGVTGVSVSGDAQETEETEESETQEVEEQMDETAASAETGDASEADSTSAAVTKSILDVLNLGGCTLSYSDESVVEDYTEGTYFSMTPSSGNDFLIVKMKLENNTGNSVTVDVPAQGLTFSAVIGGSEEDAMITVLSGDLANIKEDIDDGSSKEVLLFFEIPSGSTDKATQIIATAGDGTKGALEIP